MKTNIGGGIFHLTKYVLFFSIILLLSCTSTSTSIMRLEGNDFKENLPGLWEGEWYYRTSSGLERIKIIKIDGNKVHLAGFMSGGNHLDTDEVYGRIENSTLLLTWPTAFGGIGQKDEYTMKRDDSDNLILDGHYKGGAYTGKVQLKNIE